MSPRVAFFAWKASWAKILTLDQVKRRGFSLANRCFLCQRMKKRLITFSIIVKRHSPFGNEASLSLVSFGSLPFQLKRCFLGGMALLWAKFVRKHGELFCCAFFEQFGRAKTQWFLIL